MANPDKISGISKSSAMHTKGRSITPDTLTHRGPDLGNPAFEEAHLHLSDKVGMGAVVPNPEVILVEGQPATFPSSS